MPLVSILPGETPAWTNEYTAGAENIESYRKFSDGRVWTRSTDPREHEATYGFFFARSLDGTWSKTTNVDWNPFHALVGGSGNWGTYTHLWDFCEYKTNLYFTGYGIAGSPYWLKDDPTCSRQMGSVTVGYTNAYHHYTRITGTEGNGYTTEEGQELERFMTLMPFENGCVAVTWHWYESRQLDLNNCYVWRLNESTGRFAREDMPWDTLLNGWTSVDRELVQSGDYGWWIHLRRVTPYKGRLYYIVAPGSSMNLPMGFFSATMAADGTITSRRHEFDGGHGHVIDMAVVGGSLYLMTLRRNSASSIVHGIWKTADGDNFVQLATFTTDQYFESFTYAKGHFYLGYGDAAIGGSYHKSQVTSSPATDKAGQIWRFALPQADDNGSDNGPEPYVPQEPGESDHDGPHETEAPVAGETNGWFRVDCIGAAVSAPYLCEPEVLGFCASNAWFELVTPFDACEAAPEPKDVDKCVFCIAPVREGGANSFQLYTADGWTSVSNAAAPPTAGAIRRLRMEFKAGTAESRSVRCLIDGHVLASGTNEWFRMVTGGDVSAINVHGDGLISEFFGDFAETFEAAAQTLLERLGGTPPVIGGYGAVPALTVGEGTLTAAVPATVAGIYYTAFVAQSLKGPWFAASDSWLSDGAAHTFVVSTLDPATDKPYPALFLAIVASDTPYSAGEGR